MISRVFGSVIYVQIMEHVIDQRNWTDVQVITLEPAQAMGPSQGCGLVIRLSSSSILVAEVTCWLDNTH